MAGDSQDAVVSWLASPAAHSGAVVERIDTHSAIVFLAGDRALKLKRAVRFDYLDFSTPARRRDACEAELRLNRRTAPGLYRRLAAITREADGSLALDGGGAPIDWCVEMARFDQEALLDRVAARNALSIDLIHRLADAVARFHASAAPRPDHGGSASMRWVIDGNAEGFAEYGRDCLDPQACSVLTNELRREVGRRAALLDRRRAAGLVRQCHGDLHLRNIVLLDGEPTPFDGVEFNDEIACVDVFYDLAFLLMDLWRRGLTRHANELLNGYLAHTLDFDALALLPLFLSCRAAIRAKTSATAARLQPAAGRRRELEALAREYLGMAADLLRTEAPALVAIGGRSGSGKSTLARALAPDLRPVPGAVVVRSDLIRKAQAGVPPLQRLGAQAYTPEVSARVYRALIERARVSLEAGWPAIVDAVFASAADRAAIEAVAASAAARFIGIWLDAPADVLIGRVGDREADASDADGQVVRTQLGIDPGGMRWTRIDASVEADTVLAVARARLRNAVSVARRRAGPRASGDAARSAGARRQSPGPGAIQ